MPRPQIAARANLAAALVAPTLGVAMLLAQPGGVLSPAFAQAQFRIQFGANSDSEEEQNEGLFRSPDRETLRRLRSAREQIESGNWGDAARVLGEILQRIDSAEDFLYRPDPASPKRQSLKHDIESAIAEMPSDGRQVFEEQYGGKARRRLNEALQANDYAAVAEVARQLFFTVAGREAALILARQELERGHSVAATTLLERIYHSGPEAQRFEPLLSIWLAQSLIDSGQVDRGREIVLALRRLTKSRDLRLAGGAIRWFSTEGDAIPWFYEHFGSPSSSGPVSLAAWLMPGGNAERNSPQMGGLPLLNLRWRQLTYLDDDSIHVDRDRPGQDEISQLEREYADNSAIALPVRQILAARNQVLMRTTAGRIKAFDPRTGKLLWSYPADAGTDFTQRSVEDRAASDVVSQFNGDATSSIAQRVYEDQTTGAISSDGDTVYLIEAMNAATRRRPRSTIKLNGAQANRDLFAQNSLSAIDIRTQGKLKWTLGGPRNDSPNLGAALFFGPPLPLDGRLYALAETKGQEIRLIAIHAATGRIEWSQGLVIPSMPTVVEPLRRNAGLSPSFADGVLVCPTNAGAVAAVDLATRSLLWGFEYRRSVANNLFERGANVNPFGPNQIAARDGRQLDRWHDSSAKISRGRVIITPADDDHAYCLELVTGKLLWKAPREKGLYVGYVDHDRALVVGTARVWTLDLETGKTAWELPLGADEHPSGRGFAAGGSYYLPLSTAEVISIDLASGKVGARSRSRDGNVPGNLICYQGDLYSVGPKHLEKFSQLSALREASLEQLQRDGDDPAALWGLAEVRREEGQTAEAISLMRKAFAATLGREKESRRRQLIDTVLDGLAQDFAANREVAADLEDVITDPAQRHRYRRLTAVGLERIGDSIAAFEATMQLAKDLENATATSSAYRPPREELDRIGDFYELHRDRWVQTQIKEMLKSARPELREKLVEHMTARIESASENANDGTRKSRLQIYGHHLRAEMLRLNALRNTPITARLSISDDLLWRQLTESADRMIAGEATARLAAAYAPVRFPQPAAYWHRRLRQGWANDPIAGHGGQKTGEEIVASLADGPLKRAVLGETSKRPLGQTKYHEDRRMKLPPQREERALDIEWRGEPSEWLPGARLHWDRTTPAIVATDSSGRELLRVPIKVKDEEIVEPPFPRRRVPLGGDDSVAEMYHARAFGRMLYVWRGEQVTAIDVYLAASPGATPDAAVIWSVDLSAAGEPTQGSLHTLPAPTAWGPVRRTVYDSSERPVTGLGPVTEHGLFVQRRSELLCLDLETGREIWVRGRMPIGCELLGDSETLVAATPDGANSLVFRAMDGHLMGRVTLPAREQRIMHCGQTLIVWRANEQGAPSLVGWDAARGVEIWNRDLERGARAEQIGDKQLAVFEPSQGLFSLVDIGGAEPTVKIDRLALGEFKDANKIYAVSDGQQMVLIVEAKMKTGVRLRPPPIAVPGGPGSQVITGTLYGIDVQTGMKNWGPVAVKEQGLWLGQTAGSPLLAFVCNVQPKNATGTVADVSVLVIDKRNGRTAYRNEKAIVHSGLKSYDLQVDDDRHTVALMFPDKSIVIELTDEPLVDANSDDARNGKSATDATESKSSGGDREKSSTDVGRSTIRPQSTGDLDSATEPLTPDVEMSDQESDEPDASADIVDEPLIPDGDDD